MRRLGDEAEAGLRALDRRGFLRAVGGLAAAGLLPAGCREGPPGSAPPADLTLRHLTPRTYAVLRALTGPVVGPRGAAQLRDGALDPGRAAEQFLADVPHLAAALRQGLLVLEFGIYPFVEKLRPFTALDESARGRVLAELRDSGWSLKRQIFGGLRAVALMSFYGALAQARPEGFDLGSIPAGASIDDAMRYSVGP